MKKYQQLLLIVVAAIGSGFFIFYKHEYNRLRAVLEVLDTYGPETSRKKGCVTSSKTDLNNNSCLLRPLPSSWRQFGDLYLYSAHVSLGINTNVQVLAADESFKDIKRECAIWSEKGKISGVISIDFLDPAPKSDRTNPAIVNCIGKAVEEKPYAVSIAKNIKGKVYEKFLYINSEAKESKNDDIAVCTLVPLLEKSALGEFLELHRLVGVKRFYLYEDRPMEPGMRQLIEVYQNKAGVSVEILPWMPPSGIGWSETVAETIFINDCLLRSRETANFVAVSVNEVLIPRFHEKLQDIIKDVHEINSKPRAYFEFGSKVFCLEFTNDPNAGMPLTVLQKTWWLDSDARYNVINNKLSLRINSGFEIVHDSGYRKYSVSPDVAVLHQYKKCNGTNKQLQHDTISHRFKKRILQDGFIKLAMT